MKTFKLTFAALLLIFVFAVVQVYAAGGEGSDKDGGTQAEMTQDQSPLKASDLMGKSINDQQGQNIGSVSDLVIGQEGQVQFVVLEPSGDLQKEDELIPIPWQKIQAQAGGTEEAMTVATDMQTLQDAPTISKDQLQQLSNQEMQTQVRGYYGVEEEQQPGMDMNGMEKDQGTDDRGMGMDQMDQEKEETGQEKGY